jgi:ATP-dependent helicase/nuclease subunit B
LLARLEDILVASQAQSGWETFMAAIEKANSYAVSHGEAPNQELIELIRFVHHLHGQRLIRNCKPSLGRRAWLGI